MKLWCGLAAGAGAYCEIATFTYYLVELATSCLRPPMEKELSNHPLHPTCRLSLDGSGGAFVCIGCKRGGSGVYRYRCAPCGVDVHGQCATCPPTQPFWGHPQHPLTLELSRTDMAPFLMASRPDIAGNIMAMAPTGGIMPIGCEICTNDIKGMHYTCHTCGFFAHPLCVLLPATRSSTAHPEHELTLICSFPTMCSACMSPGMWAYRCFPCLKFYHPNCLPENRETLGHPYSDFPPPPPPFAGPPPPGGFPGTQPGPFGPAFTEGNPFCIINPFGK